MSNNSENNTKLNNDLVKNLSPEEIAYLSKIKRVSNKTRKNIDIKKDFLQLSINTIIANWSKNMRNILDDIVNIKLSNNNSDDWWKDIVEFINKLINI